MGVIIPQVLTEDRVSGAQVIDGSLRFEDSKSQYLNRTPGSAGNRQTWTWSSWVKRSSLSTGTDQVLFSGGMTNSATGFMAIYFENSGVFTLGSATTNIITTTPVYRDPGAWAHILFTFDATAGTNASKAKLYVNGTEVTTFTTDNRSGISNQDYGINQAALHEIGRQCFSSARYFDGYLSSVYFIDGQALDASYFGYTDALTNTWRPKKLSSSVAFGTNGFYLPFDGSAPIGQDQSGRGNNWTPVNFGGSNTLEKATGALPILNTDGGGKVARVGVRTDSSASSLVLALPLVGIKSDFSNAVNSGTSNKAITANGNAAASSSYSNFYGGSFYFDGTGDYLTVTNSSDFDFGSGNYTLEVWAYPTDVSTTRNILSRSYDGGTGNYSGFILSTANFLETTSQSSWDITISKTLIANTWQHLAVVRSGNTWTYYVNGVSSGTATVSGSVPTGPGDVQIGRRSGQGEFQGYMSDVRMYKGLAKYTQNFIPASTDPDILPDTPSGVSYTSNLIPTTDGSVFFDGSGDYLSLNASADFGFSTPSANSNDFTIEWFKHWNTLSGYQTVWSNNYTSSPGILVQTGNGDGKYRVFVSSGTEIFQETNAPAVGSWYHYALVRNGTTYTLYRNGIANGSATSSSAAGSGSDAATIGQGNGSYYENGFISNFHVVKGTALYTANFTPPTGTISSVANTKLLCCQSQSSAKFSSVVPVSGINDGTIWSDYFISGSPNTIAPNSFQSAFDGLTTGTGYFPQPNTEAIWQPSSSISFTTLKLWTYKDSSPGQLYIKDGTNAFINVTSQIPGHNGVGPQETTITGLTSPLKAIKWVSGSWPQNVVVKAININGTILRDPIIVNGNAAAAIFSPFTVNINAQRGKQSGYATLNPLDKAVDVTLSNGNLEISHSGSSNLRAARATIKLTAGKWYCEAVRTTGSDCHSGIITGSSSLFQFASTSVFYGEDGKLYVDGSVATNYGITIAIGDVVGIAVDMDAAKIYFYKNGTLINTGGTSFTTTGNDWFFKVGTYFSGSVNTVNFGQKPFKFPPPAGFQPLALANTPRPSIVRPDQYVGVTTYTGNGGTQSISGLNFSPDFVWIKARSAGYSHLLADSVRGPLYTLQSDGTSAEQSYGCINSFDSAGFTVDLDGTIGANNNGTTFVSWAWKAGGNSNTYNINDVGYATASTAGLTAGTITPTGASVNTKSGFSIITYTGTGSGSATIDHGLGKKPQLIFVKKRNAISPWYAQHGSLGAEQIAYLSSDSAFGASSGWNSTEPTNQVFSVASSLNDANTFVAYLWAEIPGFSKFGSYTGNYSTDGPFVYTGFRSRFIMIKCSSAGFDWRIFDTSRSDANGANVVNYKLYPNSSAQENDSSLDNANSNNIDILSNGFKLRTNNGATNDPETYIYMAFAETPTQNLYGAQANAR